MGRILLPLQDIKMNRSHDKRKLHFCTVYQTGQLQYALKVKVCRSKSEIASNVKKIDEKTSDEPWIESIALFPIPPYVTLS